MDKGRRQIIQQFKLCRFKLPNMPPTAAQTIYELVQVWKKLCSAEREIT